MLDNDLIVSSAAIAAAEHINSRWGFFFFNDFFLGCRGIISPAATSSSTSATTASRCQTEFIDSFRLYYK
jgi:hypothetical protein